MLTDEEFLCIRQLQLFDTNTDGQWDNDDVCPPSSPIELGSILLNPARCLEIEFKECTNKDNRMVLFLFLALILLLSVVTALFAGRSKLLHPARRSSDDDVKSSSSTGGQTTITAGGSPRREEFSDEDEEVGPHPKDALTIADESVYFPSLSRTIEAVRLSYEGKGPDRESETNESDSVQSPGEMFYDDGSDTSPFPSGSTAGSLSPTRWLHQREAWEEFEHSSSRMDDDAVSICEKGRARSKSMPPPRRGTRPSGFQVEL